MNFTEIKKQLAQFSKRENLPQKIRYNGKDIFILLKETENSSNFILVIQQSGFTYQFAHLRTTTNRSCFLYKFVPEKWRTKCELNLGVIETMVMLRLVDWINSNFIPYEREIKTITTNAKDEIKVIAAAIEKNGEMQGTTIDFVQAVDIERVLRNFMNEFENGI